MVRHKRRWLFVRIQFKRDVLGDEGESSTLKTNAASRTRAAVDKEDLLFPSKKELSRLIRDTMMECFGVAASGAINEIQGKFRRQNDITSACRASAGSETLLAVSLLNACTGQNNTVRFCDATTRMALIRIPRHLYGQARATLNFCSKTSQGVPILLDVFAVHGTTRTAKMAAIRDVQAIYRPWIRKAVAAASQKETEQLCLEMEGLLSSIQTLE